ncbi:probable glutamate receptor [Schistocerca piceifrons]|uniref:probable glutamate receptor n=1 Tax=Schistocerca piceifrons TaxID=274613 RepID=UPI001F5F321C|nr:probable glutamate receptor [Schistocerca piceifrons]
MWLLLLRENETEAVLRDVHIQFDSLFFVAVPTPGSVIRILEAYRVAKGYRYEESAGWGFRSRDGTWNGLVGRLLSGHVEVAAALVMMTPERHRVVDFSLPLIFSGLNVYIQEPREQEFRWVHFLLPFDNCLWLCTVTLVVTTWVVLRIQRRCRKAAENEGGDKGTYSDFLQVVGIFLMQGVGTGEDTTSRDCVRASLAVASLSALLLYTAYCGALTAALASGQPRLPFHDMSGLLRDGSYTLVTQAGAAAMNTLSVRIPSTACSVSRNDSSLRVNDQKSSAASE